MKSISSFAPFTQNYSLITYSKFTQSYAINEIFET